MHQAIETLTLSTRGQGFTEFTADVRRFVSGAGLDMGLLTVFVRHTSCSLLIQENAETAVRTDLEGFFSRLVPEHIDWLTYTTEGPDDMPAHIRAALTQTSIGIPVAYGQPVLGTWQGIDMFEHSRRPHQREIVLHMLGDA